MHIHTFYASSEGSCESAHMSPDTSLLDDAKSIKFRTLFHML